MVGTRTTFAPPVAVRIHRFGGQVNQASNFRPRQIRTARPPCEKLRPSMSVSDDPVERRVREELAADGVRLDELLNGGKVVSLTRKLENLQTESNSLTEDNPSYNDLQRRIAKLQSQLVREKRQVMQSWLKQLFVFQAFLFLAIGGALAFDAVPGNSVPLVGQALGFWTTWLFTIPALRARKGTAKAEKSALNVSFLIMPLVNVFLPAFTKNCGLIWTADVSVLAACYLYYYARAYATVAASAGSEPVREKGAIRGVLKYLDWGSWK
ncbi:hypothetical protein BWQ96_00661 [Gracilariopsis chorda]|uniref:Uncharacterized protein n=1 Tax=Gracilariopsis chorda TaxID=448386 RepID=A0A2V3J591_9FLOR|nr:hypothetical protein BWQ96_00661 [Gracilariopsis chorda]|eukprot:PXF49591.1 hypothetical protein BWQ96_00661 [Gracilariopsis chorda]